jgi:hypothetical protein
VCSDDIFLQTYVIVPAFAEYLFSATELHYPAPPLPAALSAVYDWKSI